MAHKHFKYMKKFFYFLIFSFFISPLALHAEDWPADLSGVDISSGVDRLYPAFESSGVAWHEGLQAVIMVGDQGQVCSLSLDGSDTSCVDLGTTYDLEGVSVISPDSTLVYLVNEGKSITANPNMILEFDADPDTMALTGKTWTLPSSFAATTDGRFNMEALAFVPNEFLPGSYSPSDFGGLFYASIQESAAVFVFDLSSSGSVSTIDSFTPSSNTDMSDLFFSSDTGLLYALYDSADLVLEINPADESVENSYHLPVVVSAQDDEAFALVVDCTGSSAQALVGVDHTGVEPDAKPELKVYENYPVTCLASSTDGSGSSSSSGGSDGSDTGSGTSGTDTSGSTTSGSETTGSDSSGTSGTDTSGSTTSGSESTAGESSGSSSGTDSGSGTTSGATGGSSQTSNKSGSFFTAPGCSFQSNSF